MDKLIAGLRHFREHVFWERRQAFERSASGQRPLAMLLTCSDSRVLPDQLTQADPGDLFVHRNAGNLIPPPGSSTGEAATIEYAVTALGVTDVIVCGHYRCGAVRAVLHPEEAGSMPEVSGWLAHAAGTKGVMEREHADLSGQARWDRAVEVNVLVQLEHLSQHPTVAAGLAAGTLRLHAWVHRFESGEVLAYDPHGKRFSPLLDMPTVHPAAPVPSGCCEPAPADTPESLALSASEPEPKRQSWVSFLRHDLPASLVVFLVALPFCLAIAKAAGVPPEAGFVAGIVGGVIVGLLSGSPLQVSGPSVGLVVTLIDIVQRHGLERLGVIVALAGVLQLVAGALRLGQWFRAASPAVVTGMLTGIGVVLFAQQFHVMVDDPPAREPWRNLVTIPAAVWNGFTGSHDGHPEHQQAAVVGVLTLLVLLVWKLVLPKRLQVIPAVLAAVALATTLAWAFDWQVQRVAFDSLASGVRLPDWTGLPAAFADGSVWLSALAVALVASSETLLSSVAVDRMHRGPRTRYDRELAAQGVGNAVCGVLGALPLAGGIVRSSMNVQSGARSRLATVFHGVWILAFVLLVPGVLRLIPTAALAAILVLTGLRLVDVRGVRGMWRENRAEAVICVVTAVAVVALGLLPGVAIGVALSLVKLVFTFTRFRIRRQGVATGQTTLVLEGAATFLRLPTLAAALENVPPGQPLHLDIRALGYIDHACLSLLTHWEREHEASGGKVVVDRETLHLRSRGARPRPSG